MQCATVPFQERAGTLLQEPGGQRAPFPLPSLPWLHWSFLAAVANINNF